MGVAKADRSFPAQGFDPVEIAEYNRQSRQRYESVRDFIVLHYHLNQRGDGGFWQACANMAVPEGLRWRMDLYAASGRLVYVDTDLFAAELVRGDGRAEPAPQTLGPWPSCKAWRTR